MIMEWIVCIVNDSTSFITLCVTLSWSIIYSGADNVKTDINITNTYLFSNCFYIYIINRLKPLIPDNLRFLARLHVVSNMSKSVTKS